MDSKKAEQLTAFLGALPAPIAARLAKAVELDRMSDSKALPHELILEGLRPVLRRAGMGDRSPTPLRLFCRPFEDLLTIQPRKEKQKGRIARGSIMPVWNWLAQTLIPDAVSQFSIAVKTSIMSGGADAAMPHAAAFWRAGAAAILAALESEKGRKAARTALENELVVADAREMAILMAVGNDILDLQEKIPRPLPSLTEDYVWLAREIYDRLAASSPDAAPYVAVVVMTRLDRPWEALKLPQHITRQSQDTLISSTDMGLVGEILFRDIEMYLSNIRAMKPTAFDSDALVRHLSGFTTLSTGIVKAIEMRRDGTWGQRLLKDRADVAEVMETYMERAVKEVTAALPTLKSGAYAGGPRVPDINHPSDPEKADRALGYARLVMGCRSFAPAASIGASNRDAIDAICLALKGYTEDLLKELRVVEGDRRTNAEQYFNLAIELTALVFSPEEAEILRRRARAAMPAAAA